MKNPYKGWAILFIVLDVICFFAFVAFVILILFQGSFNPYMFVPFVGFFIFMIPMVIFIVKGVIFAAKHRHDNDVKETAKPTLTPSPREEGAIVNEATKEEEKKPAPKKKIYCPYCGMANPGDATTCVGCGKPLQ
jgi:uncharacterized membrane protein YbhN (UPF0104 family)